MIPISLTLKGIYSYREEQVIDFTRLTGANIFGIFGAVGGGKSTILEAISFALYGETERLHQRDNRAYNMMNLKSNELLIDFTFKAGEDDCAYRAVAKGKRNSKNFGKVGTYDRAAYKKVAGVWEPIEIDSIENIIGLSYNNFRRTIIIPQNKFQDFLQLGDSDRREMMKQLFHLEKYDLDKQVKMLEDKNNSALEINEAFRNQIGMVNAEEIKVTETRLANIKQLESETAKALKEKLNAEQEFKKLKELVDRVAVQKQLLDTLQKDEDNIQKLERQLKEYEYCVFNFKNLLDNLHTQQKAIAEQDGEIKVQQKNLRTVEGQLKDEEAGFNQTKGIYDNREQLKLKEEELSKVITIRKLIEEEKGLEERVKKGTKAIKDVLDKITGLTAELKAKKQNLATLKNRSADVVMLSAIRDWFTNKKGLEKNLFRFKKEQEELEHEIKATGDNLHRLLTPAVKKIVGAIPTDSSAVEMISAVEQSRKLLGKELLDIDDRVNHLNAQNKLEEFAISLKTGEACPVCGSKEHPALLNITDVKGAIKTAHQNKKQCQEKIELLDQLKSKLSTTGNELDNCTKAFEKLKTKAGAEEASLKMHYGKFNWQGFDPNKEDDLTKAFDTALKDKEELANLETAIANLHSGIDKENKLLKKYEDGLKAYREEMAGKSSIIATLQSQLKISGYESFKATAETELEKGMKELQNQYTHIETEFRRLDKIITELKANGNKLKGSVETGLKTLEAAHESLRQLEVEIGQKLKDSDYNSLDKIEVILKSNFNIEAERKKINEHRLQLHAATVQHKLLQEQMEGKKYNEQKHQTLIAEISELQNKVGQLIGERQTISDKIENLKNQLVRLLALIKEEAELKLRKDDINIMKTLFKAGGFVNYVSSVYLQNLCNAANERFYQLTRHKLKLLLNENNNFEVMDFMNNGQVRSVKTLSGGQTFQAALSLALALADNIQQLTQSKQNFFFLDEGFGSLDKESLQIVFSTLQTLRKENRIVGVISHVDEMQQEIDTWLKVVNDEEKGSLIGASWER